MNVHSVPELYLTVFGWMQYENIWGVLSATGVVFIPFVVILVRNFAETNTSMETNAGTAASVRRMEIEIVMALSVVVLAAQPIMSLQASAVQYERGCDTAGAGPTGLLDRPDPADTTYSEVWSSTITSARIPVWWYGVLSLSGGITNAAIAGMPCAESVTAATFSLANTRISDPSLAAETSRFAAECFIPARSRFHRDFSESAIPTFVTNILDEYGRDDTEWLGSRAYLATVYHEYRAASPVAGFPYDFIRDVEYDDHLDPPLWGRPTCQDWWSGGTGIGLRQRLMEQVEPTLWERSRGVLARAWGYLTSDPVATSRIEDFTLKNMLARSAVNAPVSNVIATNSHGGGSGTGIGAIYSQAAVTGGLGLFKVFVEGPMGYAIRTTMPIVQIFMLAGIYMLLPFALVASLYSWKTVFYATIAILVLRFWSYLFEVATWIESSFFTILWPDLFNRLAAHAWATVHPDPSFAIKTQIMGIVMISLYLVLPVLLSMVVGWTAVGAVNSIASATQQASQTSRGVGENSGKGVQGGLTRGRSGGKK